MATTMAIEDIKFFARARIKLALATARNVEELTGLFRVSCANTCRHLTESELDQCPWHPSLRLLLKGMHLSLWSLNGTAAHVVHGLRLVDCR